MGEKPASGRLTSPKSISTTLCSGLARLGSEGRACITAPCPAASLSGESPEPRSAAESSSSTDSAGSLSAKEAPLRSRGNSTGAAPSSGDPAEGATAGLPREPRAMPPGERPGGVGGSPMSASAAAAAGSAVNGTGERGGNGAPTRPPTGEVSCGARGGTGEPPPSGSMSRRSEPPKESSSRSSSTSPGPLERELCSPVMEPDGTGTGPGGEAARARGEATGLSPAGGETEAETGVASDTGNGARAGVLTRRFTGDACSDVPPAASTGPLASLALGFAEAALTGEATRFEVGTIVDPFEGEGGSDAGFASRLSSEGEAADLLP